MFLAFTLTVTFGSCVLRDPSPPLDVWTLTAWVSLRPWRAETTADSFYWHTVRTRCQLGRRSVSWRVRMCTPPQAELLDALE